MDWVIWLSIIMFLALSGGFAFNKTYTGGEHWKYIHVLIVIIFGIIFFGYPIYRFINWLNPLTPEKVGSFFLWYFVIWFILLVYGMNRKE